MTHRTRFPLSAALALSVAAALAPGAAFAQDPAATPPPAEGTPTGGGTPTATEPTPMPAAEGGGGGGGLTNAAGQVLVNANLTINLSKSAVAKPIFLIPNIYYGITDQLTVGIAHGALPGFPAGTGSLCLGGEERGCGKLYNNLNLDILFSFLKQPGMEVAAHGGLDFLSLSDPMMLAARVGVALRFVSGPLVIVVDPSVRIGLTERDFNKESIGVPLYLNFMAAPNVSIGAFAAIAGPLDGFGDAYTIPIGAQGSFALNPKMDVGAMFLFYNLAGKGSTADARALILSYTFRT